MQVFEITPATIIIGLAVITLAVAAIRRMLQRGMCDRHDGDCAEKGCAGCGAVEKMVADMEKAAQAK
ncbi:MAG: hypothetical protein RR547_10315 [Raoultibacter sp.]